MRHALLTGVLLLFAVGAAVAADPPQSLPGAGPLPAQSPAPTPTPTPTRTPPQAHTAAEASAARGAAPAGPPLVDGRHEAAPPRRPLDLRLGDLRRYFTPAELQSPLPEMIGDEVIVEGGQSGGSETTQGPIPVGLVAPFWALSHPLSAWRVVLPDPNAAPLPPPDPIPSFHQY